MMKVKFNQFERVAGLFVLGAAGLFLVSLIGIAVKQGWFESKTSYYVIFKSAEGLHPGATVQISGLKAGSVDDVELTEDNKISVKFTVLSKFSDKIKVDSQAQLIRPFLIGDRVLEVTVGSPEATVQNPEQPMKSHETVDLMTLLSGRNLGESLEAMTEMVSNLKSLAEAFLDKDRTQSMIRIFDRIDPLLKNLNAMSVEVIKLSKQATKDDNMGRVMSELAVTTRELNSLIPLINKKAPKMGEDVEKLVANLAVLTEQFKVFIPALAEVGPDLPHATRRAVEALDEAVVLIKAMQKSFLMKGNVEDVREEEKKRLPASRGN
jgi:phospholipid/cholesterol/gamma-HCH transport system substrate-binding protein